MQSLQEVPASAETPKPPSTPAAGGLSPASSAAGGSQPSQLGFLAVRAMQTSIRVLPGPPPRGPDESPSALVSVHATDKGSFFQASEYPASESRTSAPASGTDAASGASGAGLRLVGDWRVSRSELRRWAESSPLAQGLFGASEGLRKWLSALHDERMRRGVGRKGGLLSRLSAAAVSAETDGSDAGPHGQAISSQQSPSTSAGSPARGLPRV